MPIFRGDTSADQLIPCWILKSPLPPREVQQHHTKVSDITHTGVLLVVRRGVARQ